MKTVGTAETHEAGVTKIVEKYETEAVEMYRYKGYTIEVLRDDCPIDPRTWDNLSHIWCWHRRYELGDYEESPALGSIRSWEEVEEYIETLDPVCISPLYLYDHSGLWMSTSRQSWPFNCPWDAGQIGYAFVTKANARSWFGLKRVSKRATEKAREILRREIDTYAAYIEGNVWGYVILDEHGEVVDSCWGFYGDEWQEDSYMMQNARAVIDAIEREPLSSLS